MYDMAVLRPIDQRIITGLRKLRGNLTQCSTESRKNPFTRGILIQVNSCEKLKAVFLG